MSMHSVFRGIGLVQAHDLCGTPHFTDTTYQRPSTSTTLHDQFKAIAKNILKIALRRRSAVIIKCLLNSNCYIEPKQQSLLSSISILDNLLLRNKNTKGLSNR